MNEQVVTNRQVSGNEQAAAPQLAFPGSSLREGARSAAALGILVLLAVGGVLSLPSRPTVNVGSTSATLLLIGEHSALGPRIVNDRNRSIASMQQIRGEHAGITLDQYRAESALVRDHLSQAPVDSR